MYMGLVLSGAGEDQASAGFESSRSLTTRGWLAMQCEFLLLPLSFFPGLPITVLAHFSVSEALRAAKMHLPLAAPLLPSALEPSPASPGGAEGRERSLQPQRRAHWVLIFSL